MNTVMISVNCVNFLIIISTKGSLSSAGVRSWKGKRELAREDCESDNFGQNSEYWFFLSFTKPHIICECDGFVKNLIIDFFKFVETSYNLSRLDMRMEVEYPQEVIFDKLFL